MFASREQHVHGSRFEEYRRNSQLKRSPLKAQQKDRFEMIAINRNIYSPRVKNGGRTMTYTLRVLEAERKSIEELAAAFGSYKGMPRSAPVTVVVRAGLKRLTKKMRKEGLLA
jgi:hypothetical protein